MPYAQADLPRLKNLLLELIPQDGEAIGNKSLREEFLSVAPAREGLTLDENDYWSVRDSLIDERLLTKGTGKGGSVRLLSPAVPVAQVPIPTTTSAPNTCGAEQSPKESDLYQPILATLSQFFVLDYRIKSFVAEITANQGSRATGGKWTRPDVTLVAVRIHDFLPGKSVEVITFEVKPKWAINIDGVFEASSHSAFAHRSYLVVHTNDAVPHAMIERMERECKRFGTGLILFNDPADWDTYDVRVEAVRHSPDPEDVDEFIASQVSADNKEKLKAWIR